VNLHVCRQILASGCDSCAFCDVRASHFLMVWINIESIRSASRSVEPTSMDILSYASSGIALPIRGPLLLRSLLCATYWTRIHPPQVHKNYICGAVKQGRALASTLFNMFFSELLRFAFPEDSSILLHLSSSGNRSNFLQVSSVPSPRGVFCGLSQPKQSFKPVQEEL